MWLQSGKHNEMIDGRVRGRGFTVVVAQLVSSARHSLAQLKMKVTLTIKQMLKKRAQQGDRLTRSPPLVLNGNGDAAQHKRFIVGGHRRGAASRLRRDRTSLGVERSIIC